MTSPLKGARDRLPDTHDYPDLTPPGANISGRVVKNMRICGSGVYDYDRSELPGMLDIEQAPVPREHKNIQTFGVYRPANVLQGNAHLFVRLPITVRHPDPWVTLENGKEYTRGLTGDCVTAREESDGETYLYTTGTLFDEEAVAFYEKYKELSCGYIPLLKWESGEYKGKPYHLVMYGIADANHVALVERARGGRDIKVLDGGNKLLEEIRSKKSMKPLNFILSALGAKDDASKIKEVFNHAQNAEDIGQAVDFVTPYLAKVKDCESKTKLEGFLNDLKTVDETDKDVFIKCRNYTRDLAMKLVKGSKDADDPPKKEEPEEKKAEDEDEEEEKKKKASDTDEGETGKNDKTVGAANDEDIDKKIDEKIGKAVDGVLEKIGKMFDERFPGAKDSSLVGDPTMTIDDQRGAKDGQFSSDSLMDILTGRKK